MDIEMPRMSGLKLLETLRHSPQSSHIPVFMLTGNDGEHNLRHSLFWYAEAYLTKPCTRMRLMEVVSRLLPNRQIVESTPLWSCVGRVNTRQNWLSFTRERQLGGTCHCRWALRWEAVRRQQRMV
jgi:DNA-binding response OmpR family regulator